MSRQLPVVFPVHPRTRARLDGIGLASVPGLHLLDPIGYIDFLRTRGERGASSPTRAESRKRRPTSGSVLHAARQHTKRPITIHRGTNRLIGLDPEPIADVPMLLARRTRMTKVPEGWDGRAAERVADVIVSGLSLGVDTQAVESVALSSTALS